MKFTMILVGACVLLAACSQSADQRAEARFAVLRRENAELRARLSSLEKARPKERLAHQMLDVQIRHERLWGAGIGEDWRLAQFQLTRLNDSLTQVVAQNGDHAVLQPQRLDQVLPTLMTPAIDGVRAAIDHQNRSEFVTAYDQLSVACSACHQAANHEFLVVQRPIGPMLASARGKP